MYNTPEINSLPFAAQTAPERLFPPVEESSVLSVACYRADYSASRIARAVEDAEAQLLNLNITDSVTPRGEIIVELRINHRNPAAVARSLERYGIDVVDFHGFTLAQIDPTLSDRIGELIAHINAGQ